MQQIRQKTNKANVYQNHIRSVQRQQIFQSSRIRVSSHLKGDNFQNFDSLKQLLTEVINEQVLYADKKNPLNDMLLQYQVMEYDSEVVSLLLQLAPFIYQHTLGQQQSSHKIQSIADLESVEIMKVISSFDDIKFPQTIELAEMLKQLFKSMKYDSITNSLLITANLLSNDSYQRVFRDKLLQCGFVQEIIICLSSKNTINLIRANIPECLFLAVQILMIIITTMPLLNFNQIDQILQIAIEIAQVEEKVKWTIARKFGNLKNNYLNDKNLTKYCSMLLKNLEPFFIKQNYGFEDYCINLFLFFSQQQIYSENEYILNFLVNVHNRKIDLNQECISSLISCNCLYIDHQIIFVTRNTLDLCFIGFRRYYEGKSAKLLLNILNLLLIVIDNMTQQIQDMMKFWEWEQLMEICHEKIHLNEYQLEISQIQNLCIKIVHSIVVYQSNKQEKYTQNKEFCAINWLKMKQGHHKFLQIFEKSNSKQIQDLCEDILDSLQKQQIQEQML